MARNAKHARRAAHARQAKHARRAAHALRADQARRAAVVVPLALVSAAWTAQLASPGPTARLMDATSAVPPQGPLVVPPAAPPGKTSDSLGWTSAPPTPTTPPDATRPPGDSAGDSADDLAGDLPVDLPVDRPVRLSRAGSATTTATGDGDDRGAATVQTASRGSGGEIPPAALAAYQRAETVIDAADSGCGLRWELVAAIGRVESDHARTGGAVLDRSGVARPAIVGPVLDGRSGTARIADTDAGELDGDRRFDRAVGPMQFLPSTWAVVGVDADGDGVRNPQDVDDAALGAAVYLCSADDDLTRVAGERAAVHRYNHSSAYVDEVLSLSDRLTEDPPGADPAATVSAEYVPAPSSGSDESADEPADTARAAAAPESAQLSARPASSTKDSEAVTNVRTLEPAEAPDEVPDEARAKASATVSAKAPAETPAEEPAEPVAARSVPEPPVVPVEQAAVAPAPAPAEAPAQAPAEPAAVPVEPPPAPVVPKVVVPEIVVPEVVVPEVVLPEVVVPEIVVPEIVVPDPAPAG